MNMEGKKRRDLLRRENLRYKRALLQWLMNEKERLTRALTAHQLKCDLDATLEWS